MEKNKKIKYLHIISAGKFHEAFIDFINSKFKADDHFFALVGEDINNFKPSEGFNSKIISKKLKDQLFLINKMNSCEKIILHGFFSNILIFFIQPWLHKKCHWVIWGFQRYEDIKFKEKIQSLFRKIILRRIPEVSSFIKDDYYFAKKFHGVRSKHYFFMYPNIIYNKINLINSKKQNKKIIIQVGNSAVPSNNHLEVFKLLEKYKDRGIEIICPLSYGDFNYREKIIEEGGKIFGKKFIALIDFISFKKYLKILSGVDVAIFNFDKQQGMGNINLLLEFGKKIYIKKDAVIWNFYHEKGVVVYDISEFNLDLIDEKTAESNKNKIKEYFSEENLIKQWREIFNG